MLKKNDKKKVKIIFKSNSYIVLVEGKVLLTLLVLLSFL